MEANEDVDDGSGEHNDDDEEQDGHVDEFSESHSGGFLWRYRISMARSVIATVTNR
jgi:hypothetical protein